jgi:flagellar biosynthetic protein FlhB
VSSRIGKKGSLPVRICPRPFDLQLFAEDKTEAATPRKREKVRDEGQVCKSRDLNAVVEILTGLIMLFYLGKSIVGNLVQWIQQILSFMGGAAFSEQNSFLWLISSAVSSYFWGWLPMGFFCAIAVLVITIRQVGWKFSAQPLTLKLERLNPFTGLKKLISTRSIAELLKGILKASLFAWVLYVAVMDKLPDAINSVRIPFEPGALLLARQIWDLCMRMAIMLLILAIIDYGYQKWEFEKGIKMSKQEIKEEHKQAEGDPQIKSKIKQRQREMAKKRMMSSVPKADVVITNPTTLAVALQYDRELMQAPLVVAKGRGLIARRIREIAEENGVALMENKPLAWALYEGVEIGDEVPAHLYKAVAEVLAFVYRLKQKEQKAV